MIKRSPFNPECEGALDSPVNKSIKQAPPHILYLGSFLNQKVVTCRALRGRNAAGSNRMERIADALQTNKQRVIIISPGTSLFPGKSAHLFHNTSLGRTRYSPVVFCPSVALPLLGSVSAYLTMPLVISRLLRKRNISGIIIYNFSPLLLLIAVWLKVFKKLPLFQNVEDISVSQLSDWHPSSETNAIQQIIFHICMRLIAKLSNGYITPSRKFLNFLPSKPAIIVTGCISDLAESISVAKNQHKISVLFAGKISKEHGIDIFMSALNIISHNLNLCEQLKIRICGGGTESNWVNSQLTDLQNLDCRYLGFVTDETYTRLLHDADICVSLQNPQGRHAMYKTPSKVYEYLGNAKAVIASKVGDLEELPENVISLCVPFSAEKLAKQIECFCNDKEMLVKRKTEAGLYALRNFSYGLTGQNIRKFIDSNCI